jgi:hypothetical protein
MAGLFQRHHPLISRTSSGVGCGVGTLTLGGRRHGLRRSARCSRRCSDCTSCAVLYLVVKGLRGKLCQEAVLAREQPIKGHAKVLQEVEAIRDLEGLRSCLPCSFRIRAATGAAHDLDSRVVPQPYRKGCGFAVRQQIDDPTPFQVDQDGAIAESAMEGEIVHPQHTRRLRRGKLLAPHQAEQRIVARWTTFLRHMTGEARASFPTQREAHERQRIRQLHGAAGVRLDHA